MNFHMEWARKENQKVLLKLLKKRRGKQSFFKKLISDKDSWKAIEDKILWMIQIWADTFMMHEDQFPHV